MPVNATHMMDATVSAACTVAVTPQVPESPPAILLIAGDPTGSEDSDIVTAMTVLPRPVTASAAARGTAVLIASATMRSPRVHAVCGARASCESMYRRPRREQYRSSC